MHYNITHISRGVSMFDFLFGWRHSPIFASFAAAVGGTFLVADEALAVAFEAVCFAALASPHLRGIELIDLMGLHALAPHEIHGVLTLVRVGLVVVAFGARACRPANTIVVEARAVEFEAVGLRAMAG
jgi:hypothetical protein